MVVFLIILSTYLRKSRSLYKLKTVNFLLFKLNIYFKVFKIIAILVSSFPKYDKIITVSMYPYFLPRIFFLLKLVLNCPTFYFLSLLREELFPKDKVKKEEKTLERKFSICPQEEVVVAAFELFESSLTVFDAV